MLSLAVMLDIIGVICLILDIAFGIGEVISFIPDFIGIGFFSFWLFVRSAGERTKEQTAEETAKAVAERRSKIAKAKKAIGKVAKKAMRKMPKVVGRVAGSKRVLRFFTASVGEIIPFLGALPFWTIFVFLELKKK